jgi:microcystin-dependent protein
MLQERNVPDHQHFAYGSNSNYKTLIGTGANPWVSKPIQAGSSDLAIDGQVANTATSGYPSRAAGAQLAVDIRPAFIAVNFIVKLG